MEVLDITVNQKVTVPQERILDLLICGVEGGASYWMTVEGNWNAGKDGWLENKISKGTLNFSNRQATEEGEGVKIRTIDKLSLEAGLQLMAKKYPKHFNDFMNDNEDADTGDVFLQLVVLGELIYG